MHIFTFETMQKLFDLKMRAKASESLTMNPSGSIIPAFPTVIDADHRTDQKASDHPDPRSEIASVAASVATGSSGPGSGSYSKPSLLEIPSTTSESSLLSYPLTI